MKRVLVVTRPHPGDGTPHIICASVVRDADHLAATISDLAPVIPHNATWEVIAT